MFFKIEFNQLPFQPAKQQVIYVESEYNEKINLYIQTNYEAIRQHYEFWGWEFCYMPYLAKDLTSSRALDYYAPYSESVAECDIKNDFLLQFMANPQNRTKVPQSLVYYSDAFAEEDACIFRGISLDDERYFEDNEFSSVLQCIERDLDNNDPSRIELRIPAYRRRNIELVKNENSLRSVKELHDKDDDFDDDVIDSNNKTRLRWFAAYKKEVGDSFNETNDADNDLSEDFDEDIRFRSANLNDIDEEDEDDIWDDDCCDFDDDDDIKEHIKTEEFDEETWGLLKEIEQRIRDLKQRGVSAYILEQLINKPEKLSRLEITADYRILLPDYNNMEIQMTPLVKAVYLLFLRHPEGIVFKHLMDYRDELKEIYKKIKGDRWIISQRRSIEDVTDPMKNSINEKCARVREAFVTRFDERLAKHYIITGERGEAKRIALPQELVKWE